MEATEHRPGGATPTSAKREGLASSMTAICTKGMHDDVRTSDVL